MQPDLIKSNLEMLDKLMLAITNICKDNQPAKSALLKINLFTPLLVYLSRAIDLLADATQP